MEAHDIERLRRSVAMLPPGHSAGALSKSEAEGLMEELSRLDHLTGRYRRVLDQLRQLLDTLDDAETP